MNSYQTFQTYTCLKLHFNSKKYDYFKYGGKAKMASVAYYDKRRDQFHFEKLSKHYDTFGYLLSNIVVKPDIYITELINSKKCENIHLDWMKRNEALTYTFRNQLAYLEDNFNNNFELVEGKYPKLLNLYLQKKVCLETFVVLADITECPMAWNKSQLKTDPIWEEVNQLYSKYRPFVKYDKNKFAELVLDKFS